MYKDIQKAVFLCTRNGTPGHKGVGPRAQKRKEWDPRGQRRKEWDPRAHRSGAQGTKEKGVGPQGASNREAGGPTGTGGDALLNRF